MVRMMMTDKNVGHILRGNPSFFEWVDNEPAIRDHAGVRHDNGVLALDEHNGTRRASSAIWGSARDELAPFDGLDVPFGEHCDCIPGFSRLPPRYPRKCESGDHHAAVPQQSPPGHRVHVHYMSPCPKV